jgi:hypothetical protein
MHVTELADVLLRGGEPQPARLQALPQQRFEPGLEERHLAGGYPRDTLVIGVDRQHVVPEVRHAGGVRQAEVSDSDHRQSQPLRCSAVVVTVIGPHPLFAPL